MDQLRIEEMPDDSERVGTIHNNLPVLIYIFAVKLVAAKTIEMRIQHTRVSARIANQPQRMKQQFDVCILL